MNRDQQLEDELNSALSLHNQWARTGHRLGERLNLDGRDLSCVNLSSENLSGVSLVGARLANARLSCTNLSVADMRGADIRGADCARAWFDRSKLDGCRVDVAAILSSRYPLSWWLEMGAIVEA